MTKEEFEKLELKEHTLYIFTETLGLSSININKSEASTYNLRLWGVYELSQEKAKLNFVKTYYNKYKNKLKDAEKIYEKSKLEFHNFCNKYNNTIEENCEEFI